MSDRADPAHWDRCARAWAELHQPYPQAGAMLRAAEAAAELGDADAVAGRLHLATGIATRLGASLLADQVGRLARLARVAPSAATGQLPPGEGGQPDGGQPDGSWPGNRPPLGLTPREYQVLQLIAAGRTNGQIAGELFISVKTASAHVSSILAKLQVTSRVQAATTAYRLHLFDAS
jgi:DNA-binding NarL/FixJ family response regulator